MPEQPEQTQPGPRTPAPPSASAWLGHTHWQLFLSWPLLLLAVYACLFANLRVLGGVQNERMAPVLLGVAVLVSAIRWFGEKRPWLLVLAGLCAALLCHELQFVGSTGAAYVAILLLAIWALLWWPYLARDIRVSDSASLLLFAIATYALAGVVAWHACHHLLPFLAESQPLHASLEESLENLGHLAVLAAALRPLPTHDDADDQHSQRPHECGPLSLAG